MIASYCLCNDKKVHFKEIIRYQNETTFKAYEGFTIGQCIHCGIYKTINRPHLVNQGPPISAVHYYESNQESISLSFKYLINIIKKYKSLTSILDVGCSTGILLSMLKKEGYITFGIEPNRNAYMNAKNKLGKNIYHGTLTHFLKTHKQQFDCIVYNHTLEHIKDIHKEFINIKKILKKDGIFIIGLPNTANVVFLLRHKYWESLLPDQHIWHFSTKHIARLLKQYGFQIKHISFSNHRRSDYPFIKKVYFSFLSLLNNVMKTGEAVLLITQNNM